MKLQRIKTLILAFLVFTVSGCAVTVKEESKLAEATIRPTHIVFIMAMAKEPELNRLPAFSPLHTSVLFSMMESEYSAFGTSLQKTIRAQLPSPAAEHVHLSTRVTPIEQVMEKVNQQDRNAAVVVLYPEKVSAYCNAGCYAFSMKAQYHAPVTRKMLWSAVIDAPPKASHYLSFDGVGSEFNKTLVSRLKTQGLL